MTNAKILLVEDEKQTLNLLQNIISKHYPNIITASDGKIGLNLYKKHQPDIIISDIIMPSMDGLSLAQEIKSINKNAKIIILSAYSEQEKLLKAIDVSVDKYLIKPIDPDILLDVLNKFLLKENKFIKVGDFKLCFKTQSIFHKNTQIQLTKKEFIFMKILMENNEQIVSLDKINSLWQKQPSQNSVRTFIKRLRDKLPQNIIKNIPSTGYKLTISNNNI